MSGKLRDQNDSLSVCALVPYPVNTAPSQRFRIEQWRPHLEKLGISVDVFPFADEQLMGLLHKPGSGLKKALGNAVRFAKRLVDVAATRRYDAVLIHRAACIGGPAFYERLVSIFRKPLIFDFDDAIFRLHTSEANRRLGWLKFPGKTSALCRISSHVVAGNSYLADYARQYNRNVTVVPSSVDTERYKPAKTKVTDGCVIIGWTGSSTSQTYLEMFAPVLRKLVARNNIEVRVHSDRAPELPGIPHEWRPWSIETEVEELAQFDIGIMPMPDDDWARGKCAMKALLYMAMGIPAVCAAIGANREVIQNGKNGLLALTQQEWLAHLDALINNPELRKRLGAEGRRTVVEHYSMNRCAELFARVVRQTVNSAVRYTPDEDVVLARAGTFRSGEKR